MSVEEIMSGIPGRLFRTHTTHVQACSVYDDSSIYAALEWIVEAVNGHIPRVGGGGGGGGGGAGGGEGGASGGGGDDGGAEAAAVKEPPTAEEEAAAKHEQLMVEWLSREDEPDDEFLAKLDDYTLDTWDHRTHLRIAFVLLGRHGRREGLPKIFSAIKAFIEHSPRTQRSRGTTFHETMTYFWVHMVHMSMETMDPNLKNGASGAAGGDGGSAGGVEGDLTPFKTFLLLNPILSNGLWVVGCR